MFCFRCKLMFEKKKKIKPKRPTWPPKPTSSHFTFLPASHRIATWVVIEIHVGSSNGLHVFLVLPQSTRSLPINEFTWQACFDQLHAIFSYHTTHDYFSIGALRSVFFFYFLGSSRSPWTASRKLFFIFFSLVFFSLAYLFL